MPNQLPEANYCLRCGTRLVVRRPDDRERQVCPACGWVYYPRANQASAVAILRGGEVLLVRRQRDPFRDQWTMPSGFMEYGETPEECALREMREEIGVEVALTGLVDLLLEGGDPRGLCLLAVYTGRIVAGADGRPPEPRAGDDAAEVRFFPLDQLPEQIAFQVHRQALEKLRHRSDTQPRARK